MARKKKYRARWYDANGKQHEKAFATKAEAIDHERRMKVAVSDGINLDHRHRRTEIQVWCKTVLDRRQDIGDLTRKRYESIIRNQIDGHDIGSTTVGALRPSDVELWAVQLTRDGLAPRTVKKALDFLSSCMSAAVRDGVIQANPVEGVGRPRAAGGEMLWLRPEEVEAAADAAGRYGDVVLFLAYTGLRWSEMANLTVADVDLLRDRVKVREAKTAAGVRQVPIVARIHGLVKARVDGKRPGDLVFTVTGAKLSNRNFHRIFDRALERAGLNPAVRPHDLRHSCATWLIGNGADPVLVQRWLGHANVSTTLNIYAHLWPDKLDEAAEALDRMGGGQGVASVHHLDERRKQA